MVCKTAGYQFVGIKLQILDTRWGIPSIFCIAPHRDAEGLLGLDSEYHVDGTAGYNLRRQHQLGKPSAPGGSIQAKHAGVRALSPSWRSSEV